MRTAPQNSIGLSAIATYHDDWASPPLEQTLTGQGIEHARTDLPHIAGFGGHAYLLHYVSPKTGRAVTALVVPHVLVDQYSEDYFYFDPMTAQEALRVPPRRPGR